MKIKFRHAACLLTWMVLSLSSRDVYAQGVLVLPFDSEADNEHRGFSVSTVGDVNGDSIPDVLGGAPYHEGANGLRSGRTLVFSGATGETVHLVEGEATDDDPAPFVGPGIMRVPGRVVRAAARREP